MKVSLNVVPPPRDQQVGEESPSSVQSSPTAELPSSPESPSSADRPSSAAELLRALLGEAPSDLR